MQNDTVLRNASMSGIVTVNSSNSITNTNYTHSLIKEPDVDDLIQYYKMNKINDYPKKLDGTPNMSRSINKINLKNIRKCEIPKVKTVCEECPICSEPLQDMCILKCKHKFCITCTISHFRVKNNCPLCRTEICSMPKTFTPICDDYVEAISENVFNALDERRDYLTMKGYLLDRLQFYKQNNVINVDRFVNEIYSEIMTNIFNISDNISDWYAR